jgi:hypothetical protein
MVQLNTCPRNSFCLKFDKKSGTHNNNKNNNIGAICDNLFIHIISFAQWCNKQKLQNIHHKTPRKAGLSCEVVKAGRLCGNSSQHQNLNNMYCAIFFCHLAAVGQVDLTRGWCWLPVVSGALSGYFSLEQIVNNYVNCVKL